MIIRVCSPLSICNGSMRLPTFFPTEASKPTISETYARWNLDPSPPFGPVESHMPNNSDVGE